MISLTCGDCLAHMSNAMINLCCIAMINLTMQ